MMRVLRISIDMTRRGGFAAGGAVVFAVIVASLFAIALAPLGHVLAVAAVPVLWVAVLLAALMSLETMWHRPLATGRIDALLFAGVAPAELAIAAIVAQWLVAGVPLLLAAIVLVPMLGMGMEMLAVLLPSLALGTIYIGLVGGMGAVVSYGARGAGLLMAVIILPLMLPMLLLGLMASESAMLAPDLPNPYLLWQAALVLVMAPALTAVTGWLLRQHFSR